MQYFLNYYFVPILTKINNISEFCICFQNLIFICIEEISLLFDCNLWTNHWNFRSIQWRCSVKIAVLKQRSFVKLPDVSMVKILEKFLWRSSFLVLNNELLYNYFSSNFTLDFRGSFFKEHLFKWLLLKLARCYSSICVFSLEVTGNANFPWNVQYQKATSSQKMANLHALKMPKYILVDFQIFMEKRKEVMRPIFEKNNICLKDILTI